MENPGCAEVRDICRSNLAQGAVATAGVVAVIRSPVGCGRLGEQVFCAYVQINNNGGLPWLRRLLPCSGEAEQNENGQRGRSEFIPERFHVSGSRARSLELPEEELPEENHGPHHSRLRDEARCGRTLRKELVLYPAERDRLAQPERESRYRRLHLLLCKGARPNVRRIILQRNPREGSGSF